MLASPQLHAGQTVHAAVKADEENTLPVHGNLYVRMYGVGDELVAVRSPQVVLAPGESHRFDWQIGDTYGAPIAEVGVELRSTQRAAGTVYLDYLTWDGIPNVVLRRPDHGEEMWRQAWVNGIDQYDHRWPEAFRLAQNEGRGLLIHGSRQWTDYQVSAALTLHLVKAGGIAARVQGMRRYYALLLCDDRKARLVKALDGDTTLVEVDYPWRYGGTYELRLQVDGNRITGFVDGNELCAVEDAERPLTGGGVALVCEEGRMATDAVVVKPVAGV